MVPQYALEEALYRCTIPLSLEIDINHLPILIYRSAGYWQLNSSR